MTKIKLIHSNEVGEFSKKNNLIPSKLQLNCMWAHLRQRSVKLLRSMRTCVNPREDGKKQGRFVSKRQRRNALPRSIMQYRVCVYRDIAEKVSGALGLSQAHQSAFFWHIFSSFFFGTECAIIFITVLINKRFFFFKGEEEWEGKKCVLIRMTFTWEENFFDKMKQSR